MTQASTPIRADAAPDVVPYRGVFPRSRKAYLEGSAGIRVPMREIALDGGEAPLQVYDTSGPEGFDVREGIPAVRLPWILERDVVEVADRDQTLGSSRGGAP